MSKADKNLIITQRDKQKWRRLLEDYHTLGEPYLMKRFEHAKVKVGYPVDISYGLILKISIDQAIESLKKYDYELAAIHEMRYIENIALEEIKDFFGISRRSIFYRLNKAMEKLIFLIERGTLD